MKVQCLPCSGRGGSSYDCCFCHSTGWRDVPGENPDVAALRLELAWARSEANLYHLTVNMLRGLSPRMERTVDKAMDQAAAVRRLAVQDEGEADAE